LKIGSHRTFGRLSKLELATSVVLFALLMW
jgi:hypothetical protein